MTYSIKARVEDLHEACADKNVKDNVAVIGGYNTNGIKSKIDYYMIIKKHNRWVMTSLPLEGLRF